MKMSVVGLGYVGSVTAACFAEAGHTVMGVDVSPVKVEQINAGVAPVAELGLAELVKANVARRRLAATTDLKQAWLESDVVILSVGTPSAASGDVRLNDLDSVVRELSALVAATDTFKVIVVTSTVPPGTLRNRIQPTLEESGRRAGVDFGLCFSPEFLREGTAIDDFSRPEKVVIGADDLRSSDLLKELFTPFHASPIITSPEIAETVKFAANSWHALKVAFANEIGRICSANEVDSHEVMEIFKQDKKLNISDKYLTPGFAFGGSCLPKDLRTITYRARSEGIKVPVLESVLVSNEEHQSFALRFIETYEAKNILILGLAFKSGTDDLRESPAVPLAEALLGKGKSVAIYDDNIQISKLIGANRDYVLGKLPHLARLLAQDMSAAMASADVVVIAQANPAFAAAISTLRNSQTVLDLAGVAKGASTAATYRGLTW